MKLWRYDNVAMKPTDAFTIQAFTSVLPKIDVMLPLETKQSIHATGTELAQNRFSEAAATMRDLVNRDRCLYSAYTPVYRKFQDRYTYGLLGRSPQQSVSASETQSDFESLSEISADSPEQHESLEPSSAEWHGSRSQSESRAADASLPSSAFPEALLGRMTVPILTADDFVSSARSLIRQVKNQREQVPESMHLFVIMLQRAVAIFDEQTSRVLRLLEHQLLTLEDIAHALNMPSEQAERIVQMLLKEGYIDSARSNPLGRAMAVFMPAPRPVADVNPATQFVLTSKGFFHLNPLLTGRYSEEELE